MGKTWLSGCREWVGANIGESVVLSAMAVKVFGLGCALLGLANWAPRRTELPAVPAARATRVVVVGAARPAAQADGLLPGVRLASAPALPSDRAWTVVPFVDNDQCPIAREAAIRAARDEARARASANAAVTAHHVRAAVHVHVPGPSSARTS